MQTTSTNFKITEEEIQRLKNAVQTKDSVQGLTHNYYKYPARFSPKFVKEVIDIFSKPGDVILDPFVGGGTTLVEALTRNRHSIGFDVSPIASFVTNVKTTLLGEDDFLSIINWADLKIPTSKIKGTKPVLTFYHEEGYLNNLPWNIQRIIAVFLSFIDTLANEKQQNFVRCALLRTAQWAIDCKKKNPSSESFRKKFSQTIHSFILNNRELKRKIETNTTENILAQCFCLNKSSETINTCKELESLPTKPNLVITSPPYVGVHMLYHQWQVNSRKRTRAPFWIINSLDGQGSQFYTFGYHRSHAKKTYFEIAQKVFTSINSAIADDGIVVQLVGFSDAKKFLPKYLTMMNEAGYDEVPIITNKLKHIKRIWRNVPNRKWYATTKNEALSSKEVLLIHRKK